MFEKSRTGGYQEGFRLRLGQEVVQEAVVDVHHVVESVLLTTHT